MRSEKLQDAIGMVDADLVADAKRKPFVRKIKWLAPVAAMLVITVSVATLSRHGILIGGVKETTSKTTQSTTQTSTTESNNPEPLAHVITEAEYPAMAMYPFTDEYGGAEDEEAYEKWANDLNKQQAYFGASKGLDEFFKKTISEFLLSDEENNRVYSPLNVYMALSMLAEVTDGNSRAQILELLGKNSIEEVREQAHAIWNANYRDDGKYASILGGSLWLNDHIKFNKDTIESLANNYYASSFQGDMGSKELNNTFRSWLNEQTGGLLKDQVSEMELTPEIVIALVSTIYYKATWYEKFDKSKNTNDVFHSASRDIRCDYMNSLNVSDYYWGEKFSAINKPMQESGSMWFVLPDEGISINELLSDDEVMEFLLSNGNWKNYKPLQVNFSVPKFDIEQSAGLKDGFKNLGVTDCFDISKSDFTPLLRNKKDMFISDINHSTRVKIDEKGVSAATYTIMWGLGADLLPDEKIDFVLNRPFIFVITSADGSPLFVGVVNEP